MKPGDKVTVNWPGTRHHDREGMLIRPLLGEPEPAHYTWLVFRDEPYTKQRFPLMRLTTKPLALSGSATTPP